ncbi:MAG: hypothetical protein IJK98_09160, partial [Clostridia bacterium]|nr:hypothetical protein [Clostridia bacterium]
AELARLDALEAAMKIAQYAPIVDRINGYVSTDIAAFDLAALTDIYENLKADYDSYKAIGISEVYAYFETDNAILERAAVDARYEEIEDAYQRAYLREVVKPEIDAAVEEYQSYNDDWVLATDNAAVAIGAANTALTGYEETLGLYKSANVEAVFGAGYAADTFGALRAEFDRLIEVNEWKETFAAYKSVYTAAFEPVTPDYTTDQLYSVLRSHDAWYTDLQAYAAAVNEYDAVLAGKILTDLEAAMETKIDSVYAMLNARVEATINNAYDLYQGFVAEYGYTINTADDVSVSNYTALRAAFGLLNPDHYDFLLGTEHFAVADETVAKYEEIRDAVFAFVNFDASKGLSAYKYNRADVADIIREVSAKDYARNADYDVTDEKVEAIIDMLEDLLASDAVKEKFDLSGTVSGVLDNLYTNDFLNTLVQYVYPMVAFEFAKVWADLPKTADVDAGSPAGIVTITLSLHDMPTVLNDIDLRLLPKLLAAKVQAGYPEVYAKLNAVSNNYGISDDKSEWTTNPWEDANIYDAESGKLTLDWGITDKESFLEAASAALSGVAPLLLALLSNKTFSVSGQHIGTGTGKACGFVNVNVDTIKLKMTFTGNPGYNNMLAPILASLGADDLPDGNTLLTTRDVLETGLIAPLEGILEGIAEKPLDSILRLLPTLAFALNLNLVAPLLDELKTNISYNADAHYDAGIGGSDTKYDVLTDASPIDINLGEMIDLASMGIDLTSMNGLLGSLVSLLTKPDEEAEEPAEGEEPPAAFTLPPIDEAKLAMLGTDVQWIPGHRTVSPFSGMEGHGADYARIVADNRADIFLSVLDYLCRGIDDNDLINNILNLINAGKTEEEEKIALSETVQTLIDGIVANENDAIAAVTELIFPQRYEMPDGIEWITEGNITEPDYAAFWTGDNAELTGTDWTREDALFVLSHLEDVLTYVVRLLGDTVGGAETLSDAVAYFAGSLFTADNVNAIAGALGGLLSGLELPELIADMDLFGQVGLDPAAWDGMTFSFADGDEAAFKDALITVLEPLTPLLGFLLAEQDIQLTLLDAVPVKALGYDGYSYGIVPLLEALRCTGVKTTAAFLADQDHIVANIVNPLFTAVDALIADPLGFIGEIVPSLIYFDMVDALGVAFNHLLFAVDVLLDTVRPVYDIDIRNLLSAKLDFDLDTLAADPLSFMMTKVAELVSEKAGIDLTIDYTEETLRGKLHFTTPERFASRNGDDAYTIHLSQNGKAELMVRVLDYVMAQLATEENAAKLTELVTSLIGSEGASELVDTILSNLVNHYPDSVIALVKLLFPDRVAMTAPKIDWITEGNIGADFYDNYWTEVAASGNDTLWTKDKAVYMAEHLGNFLDDVVVVFSDQLGGAESIDDAVEFLLTDLFTADNANKVADALSNLASGLGLPDMVVDIIKAFGVDLNAWDGMSFDFEDGDEEAFKAALIEAIEPLAPVLRFLLVEGGDLEGDVLDAIPVKLLGYDGYSYGLVPLLEALGCQGVMSTAAFKADKANIVRNLVNPVFSVLDNLQKNPLAFIENVVPALIYFDKVGGVQVAIENLLFSVNVVLDIIRPLYDVDIYELVEEKTGVDLHFAGDDPVDFLLVKIGDIIKEKTDIQLDVDFTVESLSSRLHFTDPIRYVSANGDEAYTIHLADEGKADLVTEVLDYSVEEIVFANNVANLKVLLRDLISDENKLAMVTVLLDNLRMLDKDVEDFHHINDVALSTVFWVFFGADSVTDASADFFHRYNEEDGFINLLMMALDSSIPYMERFGFVAQEIVSVEYPALMQALENARQLEGNPFDYTPAQVHYLSGIIARVVEFILHLIIYLKSTGFLRA